MNFQLDQRSSYSALANAFGELFPLREQHVAPPSTDTITPSYSTADATSFGTPILGQTLPVPVDGPMLSSQVPSETSVSSESGQGTAIVSPIALNVAAAVGQDPQGSERFMCNEPECEASFIQEQGLNRHFKDKHLPPGTCPNCPWFTWPRGRPGLLKAHQEKYHMSSVFHD
jgi:hypothetical protein